MKKPAVTATNHILPFGELSPAQFERLCLWLVEREGYTRFEHLGEAGSEQGRDVIAYDGTNRLWYFQCKRYQTVSAQTLLDEVEKYNQAIADNEIAKPYGIVFVTNAVLSAQSRKKVAEFCAKHGFENEFWARTELDLRVKKHDTIVKEFFNLASQSAILNPQPTISIARLPSMLTNDLFGRDKEVQMLNEAWDKQQTNVMAFVAFGGSGKSALVHHWVHEVMARENWRGAERVYAWSFWSQGTDQPQTSADPFIDAALRWFGDKDPTAGSPWDKGERLARLVKQTRTLLILDGLEPLQQPTHTMEGRLKEQSMQALLKELAAGQPGLCVVSTREHVADLQGLRQPAVIAHDLEQLSPEAGASILRQQQIKGSDAELQQASAEFGNHALALTILASFLHNAYDGDIGQRHEIGPLTADELNGGHARRVMTTYETWLRDAGEDTLLAVLRVLGLFNRPADTDALAALRAAPAIPDLTEALLPLSEPQWKQVLAKLRRLKLLTDSSTNDEVDAHPLLREYFRDQLQHAHPAAWQAGNLRLYDHLTRTAKEFPDTLEEMQPLFAAVTHGCEAGKHQGVFVDIFWNRIRRGEANFCIKQLGAFGSELSALTGLFEILWHRPIAVLSEWEKGFVLNATGFNLQALGRLREAIQPMKAALKIADARQDWSNAARYSGHLSELFLRLGNFPQARSFAEHGVKLADQSDDKHQQMGQRTTLADVLHQFGNLKQAEEIFAEAESLQKRREQEFPILYSLWGFRYYDLLLHKGRFQEVQERANQTLEWGKEFDSPFSIAINELTIGRSYLLQATPSAQENKDAELVQADKWLHRALCGLRRIGVRHYLLLGLLARAEWARVAQQFDQARRDLAEAFTIAERGEMRLHLADCYLEFARLSLATGDRDSARKAWETAKAMIEEMGYHRRDGELREIGAQL